MTTNRDWHVRRTGGLLPRGFTKRFAADGTSGTTRFLGVPIGTFDVMPVEPADGNDGVRSGPIELRYRSWPIVDVLDRRPSGDGVTGGAGNISVGGVRVRFCRFHLER